MWNSNDKQGLFPKCLRREKREMNAGDSQMLFKGKVGAIVWMDKRLTYFVTSVFLDQPSTTVSRYSSTEHRKVPASYPTAVKKVQSVYGRY